jgi:Ribbon-helix-helix protein, copG family
VTDILIRDVPDDLVARIDQNARRLGISRTEYLRRTLARERPFEVLATTTADFERLADRFAGLDDDELMRQAWS